MLRSSALSRSPRDESVQWRTGRDAPAFAQLRLGEREAAARALQIGTVAGFRTREISPGQLFRQFLFEAFHRLEEIAHLLHPFERLIGSKSQKFGLLFLETISRFLPGYWR